MIHRLSILALLICWPLLATADQPIQTLKIPGGSLRIQFVPDAPAPVNPKWIGTNLEGVIDYAPTKPFNNLAYQMRAPISVSTTKWNDGRAIDLDERGNVRSLLPGQEVAFMLFTTDAPASDLFVSWEGDGTLALNGMKVTQQMTPTSVVVKLTNKPPANVWFQIKSLPITNIRVFRTDGDSTMLFNTALRDDLKRYACLRFMDWQRTNFTRSAASLARDFAPLNALPVTFSDGVPLSVMIELCNQTGCDCWFCMPVEASADYQDWFLAKLKENLKTKAYVEFGNEVWNGAFPASRHWDADWNKNMQRFCVENAKLTAKVKSILGDRGMSVVGAQAANTWWVENTLKLTRAAGTLPDAIAIAPYFGAARKPGLPDDVSLFDGGGVDSDIDQAIKWATEAKAIADKYGVKLICYEAGQHYVPGVKLNRDPRMGNAYLRYFQELRPLVDVACHFSYVTSYGQSGSWGEGEAAPPRGPKADAIRALQDR